eukprot:gene8242-1511_t
MNAAAPETFYELLGLDMDASLDDIRNAYRGLLRTVHPDRVGNEAHALAVLLNAALSTLTHPETSEWCGPDGEDRAVFVDEGQCIGCMQCTYSAPNTFFMEDDWGRARVSHQWGDEEEWITEAISSCPVDCISYVPKEHIALLEYAMKTCEREDTAIMARRRSGNMGSPPGKIDPFNKAEVFLRMRADARLPSDEHGYSAQMHEQDEHLAASIALAWLKIPEEARLKAWPSWNSNTVRLR